MQKLTFLLGGARSGKSAHAQKIAHESGMQVVFIATAQALDEEMSLRIKKHRDDRPKEWTTLEISTGISRHLKESLIQADIYLLDCITLLVSNIFMQFVDIDNVDEEKAKLAVENEINELLAYIRVHDQQWLIISNEVGLGLVPPYQMGRVYRDLLGWANQRLAREADEVLWMVAGIAVPISQFK